MNCRTENIHFSLYIKQGYLIKELKRSSLLNINRVCAIHEVENSIHIKILLLFDKMTSSFTHKDMNI